MAAARQGLIAAAHLPALQSIPTHNAGMPRRCAALQLFNLYRPKTRP